MLALTTVIGIASALIARLLFDRIVDQDLFKRRVLVYGAGRRAASLLDLRRRSDQRGFRLMGFIATEGDELSAPAGTTARRVRTIFTHG